MLTIDFSNKKIIFAGETIVEQTKNKQEFIKENNLLSVDKFIKSDYYNYCTSWQLKQDILSLLKKDTQDCQIICSALEECICNTECRLDVPYENDRIYIYTGEYEDGTWLAYDNVTDLVVGLLLEGYITINKL